MKFNFGALSTSIAVQRSRHNQPQGRIREIEKQRGASFLLSCNTHNRKLKCSRQTGGRPSLPPHSKSAFDLSKNFTVIHSSEWLVDVCMGRSLEPFNHKFSILF